MNREFEVFVLSCIEKRTSFAIETTLHSTVTFEQAALAKAAGFATEMRYLALRDFAIRFLADDPPHWLTAAIDFLEGRA